MPRLFLMANSINVSYSPFCALRITDHWQDLGRVRENACCCCSACNSLCKSRLMEQQSVFTEQWLHLWSRERSCSVKCCMGEIFRNLTVIFQGGKRVCLHVYSWVIFYSKTLKNSRYSQNGLFKTIFCRFLTSVDLAKVFTWPWEVYTCWWNTLFIHYKVVGDFPSKEARQSQSKCDISFTAFFPTLPDSASAVYLQEEKMK